MNKDGLNPWALAAIIAFGVIFISAIFGAPWAKDIISAGATAFGVFAIVMVILFTVFS